jgi:hypothetical protein
MALLPSISIEPDRLDAEMTSRLHQRQPTVLSLVLRLLFGRRYGARFDRCQRRACRGRWGRDGCEPRRVAQERLAGLDDATWEHPTVVFVHSDPGAILAVFR